MLELIAWPDLTETQRQGVRSIEIPDEQLDYAGTTAEAIELAEADTVQDLIGLAIVHESKVVGFLLLRRRSAAPDWAPADAAVMTALRVNFAHQSLGHGRRALELLPSWVRDNWPTTNLLTLAVDDDNAAAIRAYHRAGWVDDGRRYQGRVGAERRMNYSLLNPTDTKTSST